MTSTVILWNIIILSIQCFIQVCSAEEIYQTSFEICKNGRLPNIESVEGYLRSPSQCANECNLQYFCTGVNVRKIQECMYSCELHMDDSRLFPNCADGSIMSEIGTDSYIKRPDCFMHPGSGLIPNRDFETGTAGWTKSFGGSMATTDSTSTDGSYSMVFSDEVLAKTTFDIPPGVKMVEVQVDTKSNWERPGVPESYFLRCLFTMNDGSDDGRDYISSLVYGQQNTNTWHTLKTSYSTDGVQEIRTVECHLASRKYQAHNKAWWDNMKLFYRYYPEGVACDNGI